MNTANDRSTKLSATRRDFLRTASMLTGAAALCPLGFRCIARAAEPSQTIVIRGHHLFDMLDALGTGKSSHKTLGPVAQKVRANPKVPIKVVVGVDDICAPCEWWDRAKTHCTKSLKTYPQDNENSMTSDKNALRVLGMKAGDTMSAADLYRLIKVKVTKKVFAEEVCVACRLVNRCKKTYEPRIEAAVKALAEPHS
ncbi:MAG: DUF1284 domain-containing protein [Verrucomicrobia bacterium]|nr:DUF1284 domain-containing protein [Verrucomicrobiota bacterium]